MISECLSSTVAFLFIISLPKVRGANGGVVGGMEGGQDQQLGPAAEASHRDREGHLRRRIQGGCAHVGMAKKHSYLCVCVFRYSMHACFEI